MNHTKANDKEWVSACHKAEMIVVGGEEGTNHYECTDCHKSCNWIELVHSEPPINTIEEILKGINKSEFESDDGWWETSTGAEFGEKKLAELKQAISTLITQARKEELKNLPVGTFDSTPYRDRRIEELSDKGVDNEL